MCSFPRDEVCKTVLIGIKGDSLGFQPQVVITLFVVYCNTQSENIFLMCLRSALDSIHQNHLGREGLRWNDGKKLRSYDNMPTYPDDPSVLFVWEIASKLFTKEMVSINLLFDCSIIKHFTQFYADISRI